MRDLLRRRTNLVHQRTSLLLSFKSLYARTNGQRLPLNEAKKIEPKEAGQLYEHPANQLIAQVQVEHIEALEKSIKRLEKAVLGCARELPMYEKLLSLPGIGRILGLTVTMEVGDIERFQSDGDFASYCRMVDAKRLSNGKCKADNNQKCGNKYLAWAFVEAANFARRYDEACRRWYDRKAAKTSSVIATKALGCKLAKGSVARDEGADRLRRQTDVSGIGGQSEAGFREPPPAGKGVGQRALWVDWRGRFSSPPESDDEDELNFEGRRASQQRGWTLSPEAWARLCRKRRGSGAFRPCPRGRVK